MRYLRRLGFALATVLVLGMTVASVASAADPLFLFGTKTGFKASGGAATLSTLGNFFSLTCEKNTSEGNTGGKDTETFSGTITFTGCSMTSLGAAGGTITYKFDGLLCWINEAKLEVGEYILASEDVHLEVPLIGLLTLIKGSADVVALTPVGFKTKTLTGKMETSGTGDQKVTSCTDLGVTLKPSIKILQNEAGEEKDGAIATSFTLTTEVEGTIDG